MMIRKLIEKEEWNFYIYDVGDSLEVSVPIGSPAPGFDVIHILTEREKQQYQIEGKISLADRIQDMKDNSRKYKLISWR